MTDELQVLPGSPKIPGHCTLSGKEVFAIPEWFVDDNLLNGQPKKIGPPADDAWRVHLVLVDGSTMAITICEELLGEVEDNINLIWRKVLDACAFEEKTRPWRGGKQLTPDQEAAITASIVKQAGNPPLGVLYIEKWQDMSHGRSRTD